MIMRRRIAVSLCLLGIAALFSGPARAVLGVLPAPPSQTVTASNANSVSVVWRVFHNEAGQCVSTITSAAGRFHANDGNGPLLATVPYSISRNVGCNGGIGTHSFPESVLVPADVVKRALALGAQRIVYVRTFAASFSSTGTLTLSITSASAASFGVAHEALSFDNGASVRVLPRGEKISARAEIGYNGSGVLQAVWEVAGPTSSVGAPVYSVIAHVHKAVVVGDREVLNSPALPTESNGLYLVRLRILSPVPAFETPVIRYFVGEGRPGHELPPQPLTLGAPAPNVLLAPDTVFAWEAISGARAYQLEIYKSDENPSVQLPDLGSDPGPLAIDVSKALARPAVTGMLLPGSQRQTPLSLVARQHLEPSRRYLWRVIAIGKDGARIGMSAVREFRTP